MAIKTRTELEAHFKNGKKPSQKEFADLITSTLNKRDDQFLGRWKVGSTYRPGDVVIHGRALWEMVSDSSICSHDPPEEGADWRRLQVQNDGDWVLPEPPEGEDPAVMYANVSVTAVGIGTTSPRAVLDVHSREEERDALHVGGTDRTNVRMTCARKPAERSTYLLCTLDEARAVWSGDMPGGFVFHRGGPSESGSMSTDPESLADGVLMSIQPDADRQVRVGVGTQEPLAMLDITDGMRGRFLFNPEDKVDPAFSIVNLDPETDRNYLASGVGPEQAVFITDAPDGFVFKRGEEYDVYYSATNIQQGSTLLTVRGDEDGAAQVGVGVDPSDVELDVQGRTRTHACYVRADASEVTDVTALGSVLEDLSDLNPVRFTWREDTGLQDDGERLGLIADELESVFPEAVREGTDGKKSISYHSLIPVLIRAVTEQQDVIADLRQRLDDLESRADDADQRLDGFDSRIGVIDNRLDALEPRANEAEQRLDSLEQRVDALEQA